MEFSGRIVFLTGLFALSSALPARINLGLIFDSGDKELEYAFRYAVHKTNTDEILPDKSLLNALTEELFSENSFKVTQLSCDLLRQNISAIFGPQSNLPSLHVRSICDDLEVPHIEYRWEYQMKRDLLSINLYPNPSVLNSAFITLINKWGWKDFSLVYEEDEAAARIKDFILEGEKRKWSIKLYQLKGHSSYRDIFWEIKKSSKPKGKEALVVEHRIVLDVSTDNLYDVLKCAQQVGMMTEHEKYLITSLDLHTIPMEDFQFSKTNITGLRLVQQESEGFAMLLDEVNNRLRLREPLTTLKTETALIFDSVKLLALGLKDMDAAKQISLFPSINCHQIAKKGVDGTSLINFVKNVSEGSYF